MAEEYWSNKTALTTLAAGDTFLASDASETADQAKVKKITTTNLFGGTGGIPVDVGIGATPSYRLHLFRADALTLVVTDYGGTVQTKFGSASNQGQCGTITNQNLKLTTNNTAKVTVETSGDITVPQSYSTNLNGMTYRDLLVKDDGMYGVDTSSERYKKEVYPITESGWIYQLQPVEFENIDYPGKQFGLIAEDVAQVSGIPENLVTYETYEVKGEELTKINKDEIEEWLDLQRIPEKNVIKRVMVKKVLKRYTKGDKTGEAEETEDVEIEVKKVPESINYSKLIVPLLTEVQSLNSRISALEKK